MRYIIYAGYLSHGYIFDPYVVPYRDGEFTLLTLLGNNADNVLPLWLEVIPCIGR